MGVQGLREQGLVSSLIYALSFGTGSESTFQSIRGRLI